MTLNAGDGGAGDIVYHGFTPCGDRDARIIFHPRNKTAFEVPLVDEGVRTYVERGGTADITRETEAWFPVELRDENIYQYLDPEQKGEYRLPAQVQYKQNDGSWNTEHFGFVKRIGGSDKPNKMRLWIADYAELMAETRVTKTFYSGDSIDDVYKYVTNTFINKYEEFAPGDVTYNQYLYKQVDVEEKDDWHWLKEFAELASLTTWDFARDKEFTSDRDSLADILDWVCERANGYWHIEFNDKDNEFVIGFEDRNNSGSETTKFVTSELDVKDDEVPIDVYENTALSDIHPITGVDVRGKDGSDSDDDYPYAKAEHLVLKDKIGTYMPPTKEVDVYTKENAKGRARRALKDELTEASGGEVWTQGSPDLVPNATIRSPPACNGVVAPVGKYETSGNSTSGNNVELTTSSGTTYTDTEITHIQTAETHSEFYNRYDGQAHHQYQVDNGISFLLHENLNSGDRALIITYHDGSEDGSTDFSCKTKWDVPIDSSDYLLKDDDDGNDEYNRQNIGHGWSSDETDGAIIDLEAFAETEVTFTFDPSYTHSVVGDANDPSKVVVWMDKDNPVEANLDDKLTLSIGKADNPNTIDGYVTMDSNYVRRIVDDEVKWSVGFGSLYRVAVATHGVYAVTSNTVYKLDLSDGSELWSNSAFSDYTEENGGIVVQGDWVYSFQSYEASLGDRKDSKLVKLYQVDGSPAVTDNDEIIETKTSEVYSSLSCDEDYLYAQNKGDHIDKYDKELNLVTEFESGDDNANNHAFVSRIYEGNIYATTSHELHSWSLSDGSHNWQKNVSSGGSVEGDESLTVGVDYLYRLYDGFVYKVEPSSGSHTQLGETGGGAIKYVSNSDTILVGVGSEITEWTVDHENDTIEKVATHSINGSQQIIGQGDTAWQEEKSSTNTAKPEGEVKQISRWGMNHPNDELIVDEIRSLNGKTHAGADYNNSIGFGESSLSVYGGYGKIPHNSLLSNLFDHTGTLSFWVKINDVENDVYGASLIRKDADNYSWNIYTNANSKLKIEYESGGNAVQNEEIADLNTGTWYFVAFRINANGSKEAFYAPKGDSQLNKVTLPSVGEDLKYTNSEPIIIGDERLDSELDADFDEVRTFGNGLSDEQLSYLLNNPQETLKEELGSYHPMTFQIHKVVHDAPATAQYTTRASVAPAVDDFNIVISEAKMTDSK